MTLLEANGCRFHVALDGPADAPCLVLSHALGTTLELWRPQLAAWTGRFRVLRYDARGHGRTEVTPGPYTIAQLGHDVLALLDAAGIDEAYFCGLSMGGATGLWLATQAPGRFRRFVVCDTLPWLGPPEPLRSRAAVVRRDGLGAVVDGTMERWFTPEFRARDPASVAAIRAAFLATPVEGYAACCEALAGYDVREQLGRIDRPLLLVNGTHDPSPPVAAARACAAQIPGARFVELPAAHLGNVGAAAPFNAAVLGFLSA